MSESESEVSFEEILEMRHNSKILGEAQLESLDRLGRTLRIEQEYYLLEHPEVGAMVKMFLSKMMHEHKTKYISGEAAAYFLRPVKELNKEIKKYLGLEGKMPPYTKKVEDDLIFVVLVDFLYGGPKKAAKYVNHLVIPIENVSKCLIFQPAMSYRDWDLEKDLRDIHYKYNPIPPMQIATPEPSLADTASSSHLSVKTSDTTLPTPEPIPTPPPTLSQDFFNLVSVTVDKVVYLQINEDQLKYDTAYVELAKAVEDAMEVPVIEIREDIHEMLNKAYKRFENIILEKERIAAELAWSKRMRKIMKKTLRNITNFKGYESPPTPLSDSSEAESRESDRLIPPRPCKCSPQYLYNRYPKDRFGVYVPSKEEYNNENITVTPTISVINVCEDDSD